jgi:hypothetical protein
MQNRRQPMDGNLVRKGSREKESRRTYKLHKHVISNEYKQVGCKVIFSEATHKVINDGEGSR